MIDSTPEERPHYALRLLPRAERDIDAHAERLAILTGPANAQQWHTGLFAHIATLTDNPRRFPRIAEQKRFLKETRHLLYRSKPDGPVWRVLFTLREDTEDTPAVILIHVRHGAQRPITRTEARRIEGDDP